MGPLRAREFDTIVIRRLGNANCEVGHKGKISVRCYFARPPGSHRNGFLKRRTAPRRKRSCSCLAHFDRLSDIAPVARPACRSPARRSRVGTASEESSSLAKAVRRLTFGDATVEIVPAQHSTIRPVRSDVDASL